METLRYDDLLSWPFKLGAAVRLVAKELLERGWTLELFEGNTERRWAYFIARKGNKSQLLASLKGELFTNLNSRPGYLVTTNKARSYEYAKRFGVRVPRSAYFEAGQGPVYADFAEWPGLVIKPVNGSSGRGITVGVRDEAHFTAATAAAGQIDERIVIQELVEGQDYRLLFINYQLVAAIRRDPAAVVGDGHSTVKELIDQHNSIPKGEDYQGTTSPIKPAEVKRSFGDEILAKVPAKGVAVAVSDKANLSLGGTAHDVTDQVNAQYQTLLAPLIQSLGLRICGVDIMSNSITEAPAAGQATLLELNAAPNIRPHLYPSTGTSRAVAGKIVDLLEQQV